MKKLQHFATVSEAPTALEQTHRALSLEAAREGIVLLENDGVLPLRPGRVALFGAGAAMTIKGGSGSGEVNERSAVTVEQGLEQAGFEVATKGWLRAYERLYEEGERQYGIDFRKGLLRRGIGSVMEAMSNPYRYPFGPPITEADVEAAQTDTCIYVLARQAGEGGDRRLAAGDYSLSDTEREHLLLCARRFARTVLVINVGASFDMRFLEEIEGIGAVVFMAQLGCMGGLALAEILSGRVCPSGRLADSWAMAYEDIPFAMDYSYLNGKPLQEDYKEGIYVGYRFFDRFDTAPRYPFGHGLSYTDFDIRFESLCTAEDRLQLRARVTNTGPCAGRQVLQLYARCPQSAELPKERQRLAAFAKSRTLAPGESQTLSLCFCWEDLASFRPADHVTVLEAGDYILCLGASSRDNAPCAALRLDEERILFRHERLCAPAAPVEELKAEVCAAETAPEGVFVLTVPAEWIPALPKPAPAKLPAGVEAMLNSLSPEEQAELCVGGGMFGNGAYFDAPGAAGNTTGRLLNKGIPNVPLADGPAGLRLQRRSVRLKNGAIKAVESGLSVLRYLPGFVRRFMEARPEQGELLYQHCVSFPVATALAQSWNTALAESVGRAVGDEMETYGVSFWLAPALNIHRNPLCGRNFEYFSEDPLVSGLFAAALCRGVQSRGGHFATVKHFACNNQEDSRNRTDARVSERALREIYLRGFSLAVKRGKPGAVMSSYNRLNGVYTSNSAGLLTGILREEWGFEGLVMTDWFATGKQVADPAKAIAAGNDLLMPGTAWDRKKIQKALQFGQLSEAQLRLCAGRVLAGLQKTRLYKLYKEEK